MNEKNWQLKYLAFILINNYLLTYYFQKIKNGRNLVNFPIIQQIFIKFHFNKYKKEFSNQN